jgi:Aspartyl protease
MNSLFFKGHIQLIVSVSLATIPLPMLRAEPHCPGNVASVPFRLVNRHQIIVAVSINHSGPYNFLVDTGAEITTVDPSLAADLHLATQGATVVAGVGFNAPGSFAQLDLLEAGSHAVAKQTVLVYDLQNFKSADLTIRGILGEDFLEQFDMLIDNAHSLLCLDDSAAMRREVKGPHIALLTPAQSPDGKPLPKALILSASLSDKMPPVRLKLDSGANAPLLFNVSQFMPLGFRPGASMDGVGLNGSKLSFAALTPHDLKIGPLSFPRVSFLTIASTHKDFTTKDYVGLLTMGLFKRVFINHTDHFAILDSW